MREYWQQIPPVVKSIIMLVGHGLAAGLTCFYVGISLKQGLAILGINILSSAGRELDSLINKAGT